MPSFEDAQGATWEVTVTVKSAKRCRDQAKFDLFDERAFEDLQADPLKTIDVLWHLLLDEAKERKVNREQFDELVSGDPLEPALMALFEATAFFYGGQRKTAMLAMLQQWKKQATMTAEEVTEKILEAVEQAKATSVSGA